MQELVIKNGWVVDGSGAPKFKGTIGIRDGLISYLNHRDDYNTAEEEAQEIIDADGKVVCPGFIDIHTHGDFTLLKHPFSPDKVWQGVTTQTVGHCGFSPAPISEGWKAFNAHKLLGLEDVTWEWKTFADYLSVLSGKNLGTNVIPFVGYAPIRMAVLGLSDKEPNTQQLQQMCKLVEEAMIDGAFGLTTGLAYPPQCQATVDELTTLCQVVARYNGVYATHVRDNTYDVFSGIQEAIEIGKRSGVKVHIAHLQIRPNPYHTLHDVLALMEEARDTGLDITCDQYPYLAGQGPLTPLFPAWALTGGPEAIEERLRNEQERQKIRTYMSEVVEHYFKWGDIILRSIDNEHLKGRSILTLANLSETDPRDMAMDLLMRYGVSVSALYFGKTEEDLRSAAMWPYAMVGTDGVCYEKEINNHPRTFGTFPRMIRKYVREDKVLSLEKAIHRMTGLTAHTLRLTDRGIIAEGKKADIVIFDSETVTDTPSYESPVLKPQGIEFVIVNGNVVKAQNEDRCIPAGNVLRLVS